MDDKKVTDHIDELAREEHELFERESHGTATDADRDRLRRIQVMLDQCWDLLRQRQARRSADLTRGRATSRRQDRGGLHGLSRSDCRITHAVSSSFEVTCDTLLKAGVPIGLDRKVIPAKSSLQPPELPQVLTWFQMVGDRCSPEKELRSGNQNSGYAPPDFNLASFPDLQKRSGPPHSRRRRPRIQIHFDSNAKHESHLS